MGLMLCPTHGPTPIAFACEHIERAVLSEESLPMSKLFKYGHAEDQDLGMIFFGRFCSECEHELRLPPSGTLITEPMFLAYSEAAQPICGGCLDAAVARRARL